MPEPCWVCLLFFLVAFSLGGEGTERQKLKAFKICSWGNSIPKSLLKSLSPCKAGRKSTNNDKNFSGCIRMCFKMSGLLGNKSVMSFQGSGEQRVRHFWGGFTLPVLCWSCWAAPCLFPHSQLQGKASPRSHHLKWHFHPHFLYQKAKKNSQDP